MKQLRKTIRKILLENQQHYEKIVAMLFTGEISNINQALELAEGMEYISNLEYSVHPAYYFPQDVHEWTFVASDEIMFEIEKQYPKNMHGELSVRSTSHEDVVIKLYVDQ